MKVRFMRKDNVILDMRTDADRTLTVKEMVEDKEVEKTVVVPAEPPRIFPSINAAKKGSIALQKQYGAGCLRAVRGNKAVKIRTRNTGKYSTNTLKG